MEGYIKFVPSVIKSLLHLCLPKSIGQNGMIHYVPAKCNQKLVQICHPKCIGQNGMIHLVPVMCDQIIFTSMSAREQRSEWKDTFSSCHV